MIRTRSVSGSLFVEAGDKLFQAPESCDVAEVGDLSLSSMPESGPYRRGQHYEGAGAECHPRPQEPLETYESPRVPVEVGGRVDERGQRQAADAQQYGRLQVDALQFLSTLSQKRFDELVASSRQVSVLLFLVLGRTLFRHAHRASSACSSFIACRMAS